MISSLPTLFHTAAHTAQAAATASLAAFYAELKGHDWYSCFSDDMSVYRSGEAAEARLKQAAQNAGPVHEWLFQEFRKHMGSGQAWGTPKHPLPPAPVALTLRDLFDIRREMAKAELAAKLYAVMKPFVPASVWQRDPVWPVLQKVLYLGAYAGQYKAPALITSHPKLAGAWEQGQHLVVTGEHPTV